jgi:hypothetical protein
MTFEEYKAKTQEMVNEINDICATAIVTDQMSLDEVIAYYQYRLDRISTICSYPDLVPLPSREVRTTRHPLECEPCGHLERYPMPNSLEYIYGRPGELF